MLTEKEIDERLELSRMYCAEVDLNEIGDQAALAIDLQAEIDQLKAEQRNDGRTIKELACAYGKLQAERDVLKAENALLQGMSEQDDKCHKEQQAENELLKVALATATRTEPMTYTMSGGGVNEQNKDRLGRM